MSTARRGRIIVIIVVLGCLLLAAVLDRSGTSEPSSATSVVALGPRVPAADASETAWYCAEGTSNPGGRADERIFIANVGRGVAHARITVMSGPDQVPAVRELDVAAGSAATVRVSEIVAVPEPGVLVEVTGAQAVVTHSIIGNGDAAVGPCARDAAPEWHFAAGTTVRGALLWLALFNPFADDAIVDIAFLTNAGPLGPAELQGFVVPGHSRVTVPVHDQARRDVLVATEVTARRGRVVAEQSQVLDGIDGRRGLALSLGSPTLAREWRFPNGSIVAGRTETLVVANPHDMPTTATVHTGLDGGALEPETVNLPARSAVAVDLGRRVPPGLGFSVRVESPERLVAESLTVLAAPIPSNAHGIATTVGERRAARRWVLVPARVSTTAIDLVAVLNPGRRALTFRLQARSGGAAITPADTRRVRLEPGARVLFDLGRRQVPPEGVVVIDSTKPVVVARESSAIPGISVSSAIPDLAAVSPP
jgi:hypothetical protein